MALRNLLFRLIIVQILFGGAMYLQATSSLASPDAIQAINAVNEKIQRLASAVDPMIRANNLVLLGDIYWKGEGVKKDYKQALKYFDEAADQDVNGLAKANANFRLGSIYTGLKIGVKNSVPTGMRYLERAASQDADPAIAAGANYLLGLIYIEGRPGVKSDYQKAIGYLQKAAKQDVDLRSQLVANYALGTIYSDELKDAKKAREYYEKAANQDMDLEVKEKALQGIAELKNLPSVTTAVTQPTESVNEKIKRLESTDVDPVTRANNLVKLGDLYFDRHGEGMEKDYKQALKYYEEAACQDVNEVAKAKANLALGEIYKFGGDGIPEDVPRAMGYLQEAANQRVDLMVWARANYSIGLIYSGEGGPDVKLDDAKAIGYLQKVAKQDVDLLSKAAAIYELGSIYANGSSNVKKDYEKAIRYWQKASKQDAEPVTQAAANYRLGMLYLDDLKDAIQARKYFEKVANQDVQSEIKARANNKLGVIYHKGMYGLKKDVAKAREYFEKAANQKDDLETAKEAQQNLVALSAEKKGLSSEAQANERQELMAKAMSTMRTLEELLSQQISKAQDFLDAEKLLEQASSELKNVYDEATLEKKVSFLREKIDQSRNNFIENQELKILELLGKAPTPSLMKTAKKIIAEFETLQMPELESEIESLKRKVNKWNKPVAVAEPTEEEKKAHQEQQTRQARNLIKGLDEALENKELDVAKQKLHDIQQLTITDADIRKQIATLQNQYKQQKADTLQIEFEGALAKYKEKPSSARADNVRDVIKALADLKIPERREFVNKANQQLRAVEKESAVVPEKKVVSPSAEQESQQLLFIFDPYNQLEPLPKEIKSRAREALEELSFGYKNSSAVELKGKGLEGLWRIRIGNYRIVYKMLREKDAIAVVMIDARGEIYETEDEQAQRTRNVDLIDIDVWPTDKLLSDAEDLLKKTASVADAAKAEPLLELYRWQLRGYPADQEYLKSLLLSGKAAFKMNDLAKARELFADMIPQAIDFPQIKKQAEASLAEVEKRLASFQVGRRITPPSPGWISPIPQEDVVGKLREKYQEARQLLVTNPEKATLALEQFSKESSAHAAELAHERKGADTLLNNEPLFASGMDYLEDGKFDDAISSFNSYLKEVGAFLPKRRRQVVDEEIAQSELGRAIRREVEKRLVK